MVRNRKLLKGLLLFSVLLFSAAIVHGQQITVQGTVTDAQTGNPMIGVNILVVGTSRGTATDTKGHYSLTIPSPQDSLRFSFIGYQTKTVPIDGRATINVTMESEVLLGQELVVTALGIKKKQLSIGYATQTVKGKELTHVSAPNAFTALTGKIAGLVVSQSPSLFSNAELKLRGRDPLIVVDGVPVESDSWNLSDYDIKSVTVLKGPQAAALYGSRGRNGAIQITTKTGKTAPMGLTVSLKALHNLIPDFTQYQKFKINMVLVHLASIRLVMESLDFTVLMIRTLTSGAQNLEGNLLNSIIVQLTLRREKEYLFLGKQEERIILKNFTNRNIIKE